MLLYALLFSILSTFGQAINEEPTSRILSPPFFKNVSTQAKVAFYKILNNESLSRNQQYAALIKWGADNKVESLVQSFVKKQNETLHSFRANITIFLNELLQYEKQIDSIYFDDNITIAQREHLLLTLKCPPPIKKVLAYAASTVKKLGAPPPVKNSSSHSVTPYTSPPQTTHPVATGAHSAATTVTTHHGK